MHAGGFKTGSTAIQNWCELTSEELARHGWAYPRPLGVTDPKTRGFGNGLELFFALRTPTPHDSPELTAITRLHAIDDAAQHPDKVDALIERWTHGTERAIVSCETLNRWTAASWRVLRDAARRLALDLRVIFFVRDPVPYYLSTYDQHLKDRRCTTSLEECIDETSWEHIGCLRALDASLARECVTVLSYDRCKHRLLETFLQALDPLAPWDAARVRGFPLVNRSLTEAERTIMRTCNPHLSLVDSRHLYNRLYDAAPYLVKEQNVPQHVRDTIERRHAEDLAWINARFFGGEPVVCGGDPGESGAGTQNEQALASYGEALGFLLEKLTQRESEVQQLGRFLADPQRMACPPDVAPPPGFDPVAYLLIYRDVLVSGMNPWLHHHLYGRAEGRHISWGEATGSNT